MMGYDDVAIIEECAVIIGLNARSTASKLTVLFTGRVFRK
jgi:hypothetical protein